MQYTAKVVVSFLWLPLPLSPQFLWVLFFWVLLAWRKRQGQPLGGMSAWHLGGTCSVTCSLGCGRQAALGTLAHVALAVV
jgi:hypothetical protein